MLSDKIFQTFVGLSYNIGGKLLGHTGWLGQLKHARVLLYWEREYKQAQLPLNTTSHFLISHLVGHLLEFIKINLAPPMLKIDNLSLRYTKLSLFSTLKYEVFHPASEVALIHKNVIEMVVRCMVYELLGAS